MYFSSNRKTWAVIDMVDIEKNRKSKKIIIKLRKVKQFSSKRKNWSIRDMDDKNMKLLIT